MATERKDILLAIEAGGFPIETFEFVKRKGRVHIQMDGKEDFVYFRKKETTLSADKTWEKGINYLVEMQGMSIPFDSWKDVMDVFVRWLAED